MKPKPKTNFFKKYRFGEVFYIFPPKVSNFVAGLCEKLKKNPFGKAFHGKFKMFKNKSRSEFELKILF